jgi:hypothetical protein
VRAVALVAINAASATATPVVSAKSGRGYRHLGSQQLADEVIE